MLTVNQRIVMYVNAFLPDAKVYRLGNLFRIDSDNPIIYSISDNIRNYIAHDLILCDANGAPALPAVQLQVNKSVAPKIADYPEVVKYVTALKALWPDKTLTALMEDIDDPAVIYIGIDIDCLNNPLIQIPEAVLQNPEKSVEIIDGNGNRLTGVVSVDLAMQDGPDNGIDITNLVEVCDG